MSRNRVVETALGPFEDDIMRHLHVDGSHWTYSGRYALIEVRRYVALQFDDELDPDVRLYGGCGQARCVRPPHMEGG